MEASEHATQTAALRETYYKHFYIHYKNIFSGIGTKCLGLTGSFDQMNDL